MEATQEINVAEQEVRASTNEKKFFASMKHLFATSFTVLAELMQNARRAGATVIAFDFDPERKTLKITDDGCGISDFGKLLSFCDSGWDEKTLLQDNPFGMGFFSTFFACRQVAIRSNGLRLVVTLDDVVHKRALRAVADPDPVANGTVLELTDLSADLMPKRQYYGRGDDSHPLADFQMYSKLRNFAGGFPIDVRLNGVSFDRPHAQAALAGKMTDMGFIHVAHIDADYKWSLPATGAVHDRHTALYLQGLPIHRTVDDPKEANVVVHLDTQVFTPVMPDRTHLYNAEKSLQLLENGIHGLIVEFLAQKKASMEGLEFLLTYEDDCRRRGMLHLLNDIPMLSTRAMQALEQCHYHSHTRWGGVRLDSQTISREEILSGEVKVWRGVPEELDDSPYAIVIQKMMRRHDILSLDRGYDEGHWIYQCTPHCDDFNVSVEPINADATGKHWFDNHDCTVHMVEAVKVTITSNVDPDFRMEETWTDEWVLFAPELDEEDEIPSYGEQEVTILVPNMDATPDWPPTTLCSYMDEHDQYREEWEDDGIKDWKALLAGLSGQGMARGVEIAISDVGFNLHDKQAGQMVMLTASRHWNDHLQSYGHPRVDVVDLEDDQIWRKFAKLASKGKLSAEALKQAFKDAAGVRELAGGPKKSKKGQKAAAS